MIDRYGPFGRAMSLRQMMDRLLEDAFVSPRALTEEMGGEGGLSLDVYEEGDNLVIETAMPGLKPEDIDVSIEQGVLTISGESKAEQERQARNYLVREQRTGRYSRSIRLPGSVNAEACQASYENGVLRLQLPKADQARSRRIQVGTSGTGGGPAIQGGGEGRSGGRKPSGS